MEAGNDILTKEEFVFDYIKNNIEENENFIVLSNYQYADEDRTSFDGTPFIHINASDRCAARKIIEDNEIFIIVSGRGGGCRFKIEEIAKRFNVLNKKSEFFICSPSGESQIHKQ